jgi:shikimate dehydrogenase
VIAPRGTRLGVLGWPVAHSLSPRIQNAALAAAGRGDWRYQLLPAPAHLLGELIHALPGAGFAGVNVTIPHKPQALRLATGATPRARAIGAANTLTFGPGGEIEADNTDAPALVAALPFEMAGRSALVLGAGGSARAAVWALLDAGASSVRVWNRTSERARELCAQLGGDPETSVRPADVLINCTSVGLDGSSPFDALPVSANELTSYACVADLVYTDRGTRLIDAARERGVATVDGLELLIGQGAIAFERFTGSPAPIEAMCAAVGRPARAMARADGRPQVSAGEPSG